MYIPYGRQEILSSEIYVDEDTVLMAGLLFVNGQTIYIASSTQIMCHRPNSPRVGWLLLRTLIYAISGQSKTVMDDEPLSITWQNI